MSFKLLIFCVLIAIAFAVRIKTKVKATTANTLTEGSTLAQDQFLVSLYSRYEATIGSNGHLTIYQIVFGETALWWDNDDYDYTQSISSGPYKMKLHHAGALVILDGQDNEIWSTRTFDYQGSPHKAVMERSGELKIYNNLGATIWNSELDDTADFSTIPIYYLPSRMQEGHTLNQGFSLRSANEQYTAVMESNGNLSVYTTVNGVLTNKIWSTSTTTFPSSDGPYHLELNSDGRLAIFNAKNTMTWESQTLRITGSPFVLTMQNDGNLVLSDTYNNLVWSSQQGAISWTRISGDNSILYLGANIAEGQGIAALGSNYFLTLMNTGNLVIYNDASKSLNFDTATWSSQSDDWHGFQSPYTCKFQSDGNLVIYNKDGVQTWESHTSGISNDVHLHLKLYDNGILALRNSHKEHLWTAQSGTTNPRTSYNDTLNSGQTLNENQMLVSKSGKYSAILQSDGNFVLYKDTVGNSQNAIWSSTPYGLASFYANYGHSGPYRLEFRDDGDLLLCTPDDTTLFETHTQNGGAPMKFVVQDDGNLVIYNVSGLPVWQSQSGMASLHMNVSYQMRPGQEFYNEDYLRSKNGAYTGYLQDTGKFSIYPTGADPSQAIFTSTNYQTYSNYFKITFQADGNLVICRLGDYDGYGAIWETRTYNYFNLPYKLVLQDDGNMVISNKNGVPIWNSFNGLLINKRTEPDTLEVNQQIREKEQLTSANGVYTAILNENGNLIVKQVSLFLTNNLWSSGTYDITPLAYCLIMQEDGNLCLYDGSGTLRWESHTYGLGNLPYKTVMQNDGNFVIKNSLGNIVWQTNTAQS